MQLQCKHGYPATIVNALGFSGARQRNSNEAILIQVAANYETQRTAKVRDFKEIKSKEAIYRYDDKRKQQEKGRACTSSAAKNGDRSQYFHLEAKD
mmetsp:Transcript_118724/g.185348  ORF Transcript_118724/g.185348 Transcript_118724/m.185348 type:complete len:96 (+) Transcript_118724:1357-1644(+)